MSEKGLLQKLAVVMKSEEIVEQACFARKLKLLHGKLALFIV